MNKFFLTCYLFIFFKTYTNPSIAHLGNNLYTLNTSLQALVEQLYNLVLTTFPKDIQPLLNTAHTYSNLGQLGNVFFAEENQEAIHLYITNLSLKKVKPVPTYLDTETSVIGYDIQPLLEKNKILNPMIGKVFNAFLDYKNNLIYFKTLHMHKALTPDALQELYASLTTLLNIINTPLLAPKHTQQLMKTKKHIELLYNSLESIKSFAHDISIIINSNWEAFKKNPDLLIQKIPFFLKENRSIVNLDSKSESFSLQNLYNNAHEDVVVHKAFMDMLDGFLNNELDDLISDVETKKIILGFIEAIKKTLQTSSSESA